jgi:threonine dehydrogenase-like Zn-dependent dehydrogenase
MLALEYQEPGRVALRDMAAPEALDGEIVVDVVAAGICGTDLKIVRGEHRLYPAGTVRIPGHEFVGRIRQNRSVRSDLEVGTLVAVAPNIGCGHCLPCRAGRSNLCEHYESIGLTMDGAFAQIVRVPGRAVEQGNVLPVPAGLSPDVAVLMEPLAAVSRGFAAIDLGAGDSVVVCGAGPIGLLAVLLARQVGAGRIIVSQTSAARRALAAEFGADATVDPRAEDFVERVLAETGGAGADCVIVATPAPAVYGQAVRMAAIGGRVNYFAGLPSGRGEVTIDANLVHYRELRVTGTTANTTEDCARALAVLAEHPDAYSRLVTHRFALEDAVDAFAAATDGTELKVVVTP